MKKKLGPKKIRDGWLFATLDTDRDYFSLTGELYGSQFFHDRSMIACGQLQDDILPVWPELKPFAMLHLSNMEGEPMHAEANGWYWIEGALGGLGGQYHAGTGSSAKTPDECRDIFESHIHVGRDISDHIIGICALAYAQAMSESDEAEVPAANRAIAAQLARETWRRSMESLRPLWKEQAATALKLMQEIPAT